MCKFQNMIFYSVLRTDGFGYGYDSGTVERHTLQRPDYRVNLLLYVQGYCYNAATILSYSNSPRKINENRYFVVLSK